MVDKSRASDNFLGSILKHKIFFQVDLNKKTKQNKQKTKPFDVHLKNNKKL